MRRATPCCSPRLQLENASHPKHLDTIAQSASKMGTTDGLPCHDCQVEAAMITGALLGVAVIAAHVLTKAGPGINPLLPSSDPRLGVG